MEKPRKKSLDMGKLGYEIAKRNQVHNEAIDAMSTWLEGEVKELIEELKRVDHHTVAEEIWRVQDLLRKLTGKV